MGVNTGLEVLNTGLDRQSRLLADISAKVESALRFLVKSWQELRGSWGARSCRTTSEAT